MWNNKGYIEQSSEIFYIKAVLNEVADIQDCNFIKKRHKHRCSPVKYCEILKNTYSEEHLQTAVSELVSNP